MKVKIALLVFFGAIALVRADQTIEKAQQILKDQGFYYGEVTGEKNSETVAAIRRYQIRNGLPVTGELDEATLQLLRRSVASTPPPAATNTPSVKSDAAELHEDAARDSTGTGPVPAQTREADSHDLSPPPSSSPLFAGTPYETSPPAAQRDVIAAAQRALTQHGIYRHEINGTYGPDLEFSLRAYQSRVGLAVSGRLDLATLAALELLPGANTPVYIPRKSSRPRAGSEPPVRGEWIHQ